MRCVHEIAASIGEDSNGPDFAIGSRVPPASDERLDSLAFEGVTLVRDGEGPVLSGQVIYNGEARDVADLPRPALLVLSRLLRFFHFS